MENCSIHLKIKYGMPFNLQNQWFGNCEVYDLLETIAHRLLAHLRSLCPFPSTQEGKHKCDVDAMKVFSNDSSSSGGSNQWDNYILFTRVIRRLNLGDVAWAVIYPMGKNKWQTWIKQKIFGVPKDL